METDVESWEVLTFPDPDWVDVSIRRLLAHDEYEYVIQIDGDGPYMGYLYDENLDPREVTLPIPLDVAAALFLGLHRLFGNHDPKGTRHALRKAIQRIEAS